MSFFLNHNSFNQCTLVMLLSIEIKIKFHPKSVFFLFLCLSHEI